MSQTRLSLCRLGTSALCGWLALVAAAGAQTSYPMLMDLRPTAIQIGSTAELQVSSRFGFAKAYQALFSGSGLSAEISPESSTGDSLKMKVTATSAAEPGVREFRVATPRGVSTIGQIVVVRDPVISEKGSNDTLATAQAITLPAAVCGSIEKAEDLDVFKFTVKAGQALTFHVLAARLEDKIHDLQEHVDPLLTLKNARGVDLAQVDNYFFADPLLHYRFEQAGEYFLEIRDVRYKGNAFWQYCLEIHDRPFVTNVFPLQVRAGAENQLQLIGQNLPPEAQLDLPMPAELPMGRQSLVLPMGDTGPAGPVPAYASPLPSLLEISGDNNSQEKAQEISVPSGVNGRIESPADLDVYKFAAKKGERFSFQIVARRYQSALDSNLRILNEKGQVLVENDDLKHGRHISADSLLEFWSAPADGTYFIEVRDLLLRGGPEFVYLLEITRAEPYFYLQLDTDKSLVSPGGSAAVFVRAFRVNGFTGEIKLHVEGLPESVTAECGRILADGQDGAILLTAASDAPLQATNLRVWGEADFAPTPETKVHLVADAEPLQETYFPGGGRGHFPVDMHTLAVCAPRDILRVLIEPKELVLKPGESQKIEVKLERAAGFDKNVTLDVIYRHLNSVFGDTLPKGVTLNVAASKVLITGKSIQGQLTFKVDPKAEPVERQLVPVMAHVSINFVMKVSYCAEPFYLSVRKE